MSASHGPEPHAANATATKARQPRQPRWSFLNWAMPLTGFLALVWFLIRVLPKPSRAMYPCQRAAFPVASAFVLWMVGFFGAAAALRTARSRWIQARRTAAAVALVAFLACLFFAQSFDGTRSLASYAPADPPNTPIGEAKGIFPGRVVWTHDPAATTWDPSLDDHSTLRYWDDQHTSQTVVDAMMSTTLHRLTEQSDDPAAWDALFRDFNRSLGRGDVGYRPGQRIAIKVNHVEHRSQRGNAANTGDNRNYADLSPQVVVALLKQLVWEAGIPEDRICVTDPSRFIADKTYDRCVALFPDVVFAEDNFSFPSNPAGVNGRIKSEPTSVTLLHYSGTDRNGSPIASDYLPMPMYEADYIINLAILKGHPQSGITLCGKNWYGTLCKPPTGPHHDLAWMTTGSTPEPGSYRTMVDMMGHEHLGGKTMLYLLDGLWGFQFHGANSRPMRWNHPPFNGDYPSSLIASQDPVAIDSVGHDFLQAEFSANMGGNYLTGAMDDYLHEAALAHAAPSGALYDPENDAIPLASLGTHEHWNSPVEKLYSRNINTGEGIELIAISPHHVRASGTVTVEVVPAEAQWTLVGPERLALVGAGDASLDITPTGLYGIEWAPVEGYVTPNEQTLYLNTDGTIVFEAAYESETSVVDGWLAF